MGNVIKVASALVVAFLAIVCLACAVVDFLYQDWWFASLTAGAVFIGLLLAYGAANKPQGKVGVQIARLFVGVLLCVSVLAYQFGWGVLSSPFASIIEPTIIGLADTVKSPEEKHQIASQIVSRHPNGFAAGAAREKVRAFYLMRSAKEAGDVQAEYELAMMFGLDPNDDPKEELSYPLLEDAASKGSGKAKAELAYRHWVGTSYRPGTYKDNLARFQAAGPDGMDIIANNLNLSADIPTLQPCQQDEILNLMKVSAGTGNVKAMKKLAFAYKNGACGIKPDATMASYYEQKIQEQSGTRQ